VEEAMEEAVGKNFFDLAYPDELAARLQRQIQQVIDTLQILRDQTPYVGAAGETGYYEYTFVPVIGETGEVEAVAGSTRDVTDHVRMKQALALSQQNLQQMTVTTADFNSELEFVAFKRDERFVARYFGVDVETVRGWRKERTGPTWRKIGGRLVRYSLRTLDEWTLAQPHGG
jgi:PAS domain-containing protein/helix-turn-helix protein